MLEGGQVGADWLSPTVLTYLVDQLVKGTDAEARAASEDFEWHIFPIVNPDGHQFTQDSVSFDFFVNLELICLLLNFEFEYFECVHDFEFCLPA